MVWKRNVVKPSLWTLTGLVLSYLSCTAYCFASFEAMVVSPPKYRRFASGCWSFGNRSTCHWCYSWLVNRTILFCFTMKARKPTSVRRRGCSTGSWRRRGNATRGDFLKMEGTWQAAAKFRVLITGVCWRTVRCRTWKRNVVKDVPAAKVGHRAGRKWARPVHATTHSSNLLDVVKPKGHWCIWWPNGIQWDS